MPYNAPNSRGGKSSKGFSVATNHSLAFLVLVALVVLWALRHVFGSVSVEAGTK